MWFEGKSVAEIDPSEIVALVNEKVPEDAGIEFKREPQGGVNPTDGDKRELCCDISSFANADGGPGYIVIGIRDEGNRAVGWVRVTDALRHVNRIRQTCHDGIEPRIPDLDIGIVAIPDRGDVIVVRVPEGARKPYMVKHSKSTHFCRRYVDGKREMTYAEIRHEFRSEWSDTRLAEMDGKLNYLIAQETRQPVTPLGAESDALALHTAEQVQQVMEARLRKVAEE